MRTAIYMRVGNPDQGYDRHCSLTLIHRQFCISLALVNHTPREVMQVSTIFTQKKFVTLT